MDTSDELAVLTRTYKFKARALSTDKALAFIHSLREPHMRLGLRTMSGGRPLDVITACRDKDMRSRQGFEKHLRHTGSVRILPPLEEKNHAWRLTDLTAPARVLGRAPGDTSLHALLLIGRDGALLQWVTIYDTLQLAGFPQDLDFLENVGRESYIAPLGDDELGSYLEVDHDVRTPLVVRILQAFQDLARDDVSSTHVAWLDAQKLSQELSEAYRLLDW